MYKIIIFLVIIFGGSKALTGHDIKIARFNIEQVQNELALTVQFDYDYIKYVLGEECDHIPLTYNRLNKSVKEYLLDNFSVLVQHEYVDFDLNCFEYENGFLYASGLLDVSPSQLESLTVYNTCMIRTIHDHNNIISLDLNGDLRSFRMHSNRIQTEIKL
jgi:hypothetical protein